MFSVAFGLLARYWEKGVFAIFNTLSVKCSEEPILIAFGRNVVEVKYLLISY